MDAGGFDRNLNVTIVTSNIEGWDMNDNHRRVLETYINNTEESLREIQDEIGAQSDGTLLVHDLKPDISEKTRARLLQGIADMLGAIKSMKREYALEAQEGSLRKHVNNLLLDVEITVDELRASSLENYGPMTRADKDRLEPEIGNLLRILNGLFSVLADKDA